MGFITPTTMPFFVAAGWTANRAVAVSLTIPDSHPAAVVLKQFSGLVVRPHGSAGKDCATSPVSFSFGANTDDISELEETLGCKLVHIAETDDGNSFLFIGACGRCIGSSGIHRAYYLVGESFHEAIDNLLIGRRSRPMLTPSQSFVMLYGERFERGNSAIWEHRHEA